MSTTRSGAPSQFIGVDFSGARLAGRAIWIAWGEARGRRFIIRECLPAEALPGGASDRANAHAALVRCIASSSATAVGLDFPFSLPAAQLEARTWLAFLRAFPRRFPAADAFHATTQARFGEARRRTDREARAPFAVNNLRLYRQTYYGLRDILLPLVTQGEVRAVPMQAPRPGFPSLLETCPATALLALGIRRPYKGKSGKHRLGRKAILDYFESRMALALDTPTLRRRVLRQSGGDALDSIIAAWIAWRATSRGEYLHHGDTLDRLEGRIYTGG